MVLGFVRFYFIIVSLYYGYYGFGVYVVDEGRVERFFSKVVVVFSKDVFWRLGGIGGRGERSFKRGIFIGYWGSYCGVLILGYFVDNI